MLTTANLAQFKAQPLICSWIKPNSRLHSPSDTAAAAKHTLLSSRSSLILIASLTFDSTLVWMLFLLDWFSRYSALSSCSDRSLYYRLVFPYLIYCVSVWGSTYHSNLKRITILQRKIIRIISKASFDPHTYRSFKEQMILKFPDIYLYQIGKFMYLFKIGLLPHFFQDMFILASQVHSYNTKKFQSSVLYISLSN